MPKHLLPFGLLLLILALLWVVLRPGDASLPSSAKPVESAAESSTTSDTAAAQAAISATESAERREDAPPAAPAPTAPKEPAGLYLRVTTARGLPAARALVRVMEEQQYAIARPDAPGRVRVRDFDPVNFVLQGGRPLAADARGELRFSSRLPFRLVAAYEGEIGTLWVRGRPVKGRSPEHPLELRLEPQRALLVETVDSNGAPVGGVAFLVRDALESSKGLLWADDSQTSYYRTDAESGERRIARALQRGFDAFGNETLRETVVVELAEPGLGSVQELVAFGAKGHERVRLVLPPHGSVHVTGLRPPALRDAALFASLEGMNDREGIEEPVAADGSILFERVGLEQALQLQTLHGRWSLPALQEPGQRLEFDVRTVPHARILLALRTPEDVPFIGTVDATCSLIEPAGRSPCGPAAILYQDGLYVLDPVPLRSQLQLHLSARSRDGRSSYQLSTRVAGPEEHGKDVRLRLQLVARPERGQAATGERVVPISPPRIRTGSNVTAYVLREPAGIENLIEVRLVEDPPGERVYRPQSRNLPLLPEARTIPYYLGEVGPGSYALEICRLGESRCLVRIPNIEVRSDADVEDPRLAAIDLSSSVKMLALQLSFPERAGLLARYGGVLLTRRNEGDGPLGYPIGTDGSALVPFPEESLEVLPIVPGARFEWTAGIRSARTLTLHPAYRVRVRHQGGPVPLPAGVRLRAFLAHQACVSMLSGMRGMAEREISKVTAAAMERTRAWFDAQGLATLECPAVGQATVKFQLRDERDGHARWAGVLSPTRLVDVRSGVPDQVVEVEFDPVEIRRLLDG